VCNLATVINTATNETRFLYLRKFFLLYIGITLSFHLSFWLNVWFVQLQFSTVAV